jgi:hypothetical protein
MFGEEDVRYITGLFRKWKLEDRISKTKNG